jgi:hypothetical protein
VKLVGILGVSLFVWISYAQAQSASPLSFDPIPGPITFNATQQAAFVQVIKAAIASAYGSSPAAVRVGETTVWRKSHGDGFIACISQSGFVMALSISTGPFRDFALKNIWNETDYNIYGCNTDGWRSSSHRNSRFFG